MRIPPIKKFQFFGSLLMFLGLLSSGSGQSLLLLAGSMLLLAALLTRMYLIHLLFHIPVSRHVLNYIFVPMTAFLAMGHMVGYQPAGITPGMWHYLLVWSGAVLGVSTFIHTVTRRLLALPWRQTGRK
jgi:hypothetical protein